MVNEAKSSNRTLVIVLAVAALLVALAVIVAVVMVVTRSGDEVATGVDSAASASVLPADTFMFASFNPHLDQVKNFEVIEKAWGDNPLIQKGLAGLKKEMSAGDFDFQAEINSWLGDEVSLAVGGDLMGVMLESLSLSTDAVFEEIARSLEGDTTAPSSMPASQALPEVYIVAATKDTAASDQFLTKLRSYGEKGGAVLQDSDYKGVKIVSYAPEFEGDMGWAYATLDNLVVFAAGQDGLAAMKKVIDAQQGGNNLASQTTYQAVLDKLPADQIGYGYMNLAGYIEALLSASGAALDEIPPGLLDLNALKAYQGMGFSVGFEPNGLRADMVAVYDKEKLPDTMLGMGKNPNKAAGYVPDDTLLYISGAGLGNVVQMILDLAKADPSLAGPEFEQSLAMLEGMLGVKFEDLVNMLSGEFALAITHDPAGIGGNPSTPIGLSLLIEARERDKYEKMLKQLATLLKGFAETEIPTQTINGVEAWMLNDPYSGNMMVGWGVGKDFFGLATSEALLEMAFGGGGSKLADDALYKAATAPLPKDKGGVFYVNFDQFMNIIYQSMPSGEQAQFNLVTQGLIGPIKAISAASEPLNPDKSFVTSTFFILIESE